MSPLPAITGTRAFGPMVLLVLLAAVAPSAEAVSPSGATGFTYSYSNPAFFSFRYAAPGSGLPGYSCHVVGVTDGSPPGGWGGAQMPGPGGTWVELSPCTNLPNGTQVRINTWSRLVVTDPLADPAAAAPRDGIRVPGGGCDCTLNPGLQVWGTGPDDPTMPADIVGSPVAVAFADLNASFGPFEFVIDFEDPSGITRITNSPRGQGPVIARALVGPQPNPITLFPGESILYLPTGEIAGFGTVMVRGLGDVPGVPGQLAGLDYEVFNLSMAPATFQIEIEDGLGWGPIPSVPIVTVPAQAMVPVHVTVFVPGGTAGHSDGILLRARDVTNPTQSHTAMRYVIVEEIMAAGEPPVGNRPFLAEIHPNPAMGSAKVDFWLDSATMLRAAVYDAAGREVADLLARHPGDREWCAGWHTLRWDGRDETGRSVPSGIYFVQVSGRDWSEVRRLMFLR